MAADLSTETLAKLCDDEGAMHECGDDDNAAKYAHAAACVRRVRELEVEVERLRESLRLADTYVSLSPCDPDIYADQWEAWKLYDADKNLRAAATGGRDA